MHKQGRSGDGNACNVKNINFICRKGKSYEISVERIDLQ